MNYRHLGNVIVPSPTTDAAAHIDPTIARVLDGIRSEVGVIPAIDRARIAGILAPHTPTGDAARDAARDAGRAAGALVRQRMEHNAKLAQERHDVWTARNAELMNSIRR